MDGRRGWNGSAGLGRDGEPSGGPAVRPGQAGDATRPEHDATACHRVPECGRRAGAGATGPRQFLIDLRRAPARRSGCCLRAWRSARDSGTHRAGWTEPASRGMTMASAKVYSMFFFSLLDHPARNQPFDLNELCAFDYILIAPFI